MVAPTLAGGAAGWSLRQAVLAAEVERRAAYAAVQTGLVPRPPFLRDGDLLSLKTLSTILRLDRSDLWLPASPAAQQVRLKEADRAARYVWQHPHVAATLLVTGSAARLAESAEERLQLVNETSHSPAVLLPLYTWCHVLRGKVPS